MIPFCLWEFDFSDTAERGAWRRGRLYCIRVVLALWIWGNEMYENRMPCFTDYNIITKLIHSRSLMMPL